MEEAGSENPWKQYPGQSEPYLRVKAGPTPSTGEITWSSDGTKRLADRVIELKDHESGVREHDILSTAIDTPEHTGRVRGVSSSRGWKETFGKEHEGLWKKKDDIFATLRVAEIDVEAALLAAARVKSSCASKEVVQQVPEEEAAAPLPNPTSPSQRSMLNPRPPSPSIGPIFDQPDTIERLNNVPTPCSIITGSYSTLLIEIA